MRGRRIGARMLAVVGLLGSLLAAGVPPAANAEVPAAALSPAPERLLVIVPHPDDETLAGTGMIRRTLAAGGQVKVAVMTNGDGFRRAAELAFQTDSPTPRHLYRLGQLRQQEELQAVRQLGLKPQDVLFLGYPDAGLHRLWTQHWNDKRPFQSLNGHRQVPYALAYRKSAPYCGQAVIADLRGVIEEFQPTDVLYPDPLDVHNDHWATSAFSQYALAGTSRSPKEWTYLIHFPNFPLPRAFEPSRPLERPASLATIGNHWLAVPLQPQEIERKHRALLEHRTQVQVMRGLLESFVRKNDLVSRPRVPQVAQMPVGTNLFAKPLGKGAQAVADPVGDQRHGAASDADILSVAVGQAGERLEVRAELAGVVRPGRQYAFRFRMPDAAESDLSRLDVRVKDGRLSCQQQPDEIGACASDIHFQQQGNCLSLSVPRSYYQRALMVSFDVGEGHYTLDQTPWRRFRLP